MKTLAAAAAAAEVGRRGEAAAQRFLEERCGCRIVDVNVRFGASSGLRGEIDIIAWDGATLCFVEVKTRRDTGRQPARRNRYANIAQIAPAEAVTPAKQRQIARLALAYASRHGLLSGETEIPLRFDVVSVLLADTVAAAPDALLAVRRVERITGAFLAPDSLLDEEE